MDAHARLLDAILSSQTDPSEPAAISDERLRELITRDDKSLYTNEERRILYLYPSVREKFFAILCEVRGK